MLDASPLSPVVPYKAAHFTCEPATEPWQLSAYFRLRHAIFVSEQRLFDVTDRDEFDAFAMPIVAVTQLGGMPDEVVGVVRIYRTDPGTWYGGRLGVSASYRSQAELGSELIRCAVSTANARGCRLFLATVQAQNVRYFERRHFRRLCTLELCGRAHELMQADLAHYPARGVGERRAA